MKMKYEETDVIELKRNLNDTFEKEIVAFLNTNGGTIYIGVNDDGSIYGVDNLDKTMKNIADIITDKILPNAQHLITPIAKLEEGKMIIEISVKKGDSLYYIKRYGRSASGCFIRIGTTVRGMSEDQIDKALIKSLHIQKPKIIDI